MSWYCWVGLTLLWSITGWAAILFDGQARPGYYEGEKGKGEAEAGLALATFLGPMTWLMVIAANLGRLFK